MTGSGVHTAASPGTFTPPASRGVRPTRGRSILETVDRLRLAAIEPVTGTLGRPVDLAAAAAPLREGIDSLRARAGSRVVRAPSQATLERAITAWAERKPNVAVLGPRYIRALCAHAAAVRDPAFVSGLKATGELPRRRRWVESLVGVYEAEWRPVETADALEPILVDAVRRFEGRSARVDRLQPIASRYFSPKAAEFLAEQVTSTRQDIKAALDRLGTPLDSRLARAAASAAAATWVEELCRARTITPGVHALLEYGLSALLASTLIEPRVLADVVGRVLTWVPEADERATARLRDWLLSDARFGDPRLPVNQAKWATLPTAARERMIRWLAKGDLIFFFDFVMDHVDDVHGRKDFWLQYIEQVEDSAVALSSEDIRRLKLTVSEQLRYARATSPSDDVSAFLMRFRGARRVVVAEFSQSGNAAYVHDAEAFDRHVGGLRKGRYDVSTSGNGLKSKSAMITKYSHIGNWEWRVHNELARLGVRRGR
jgi:hypothetical protein